MPFFSLKKTQDKIHIRYEFHEGISQMFVVVVAVVVVFLFVPACITMHSGLCSPVLSGSVDE